MSTECESHISKRDALAETLEAAGSYLCSRGRKLTNEEVKVTREMIMQEIARYVVEAPPEDARLARAVLRYFVEDSDAQERLE
jgi:hypothetical protein